MIGVSRQIFVYFKDCWLFERTSLYTDCYDFKALVPKQAPTLSNITLSLLPFPIITLSFHFIPISPYRFISFRTLVLLITYPETCYTDSLSFFPSYFPPHFYLPPCKIATSYLSP